MKSWRLEFSKRALKNLRGLRPSDSDRIVSYLENAVLAFPDPRRLGKPLSGSLAGFWRYRVGDYRIIVQIEDDRLVVLVVAIGHRREVYR